MIQRIQTVFLLCAALLNLGAFFTPVYSRAVEDPQMWIGIGLALALTIAMVITVVSIFLYKKRRKQIQIVKIATLFEIIGFGFCVGILFSLGGIGTYLWDEALGTGLVLIALFLQLLAVRFIDKDEKLVRSMDRIR